MVEIILGANVLLINIFVAYHLFFLALYPILKKYNYKTIEKLSTKKLNKFAILVPAHNEELMIGDVIDNILSVDYPKDKYDLIIIADNCADRTADIACDRGAACYERNDEVNKGKPYALNWVFNQINIDNYDAFTIIDADTFISKKYLEEMNKEINHGADAIQGYFGIMNPDETWLTRIMAIPGVIKFNVRYFTKQAIGLSCPLMGNGMCFSKNIIKKYGWNAYSITENWEYYLKLILKDHSVGYSPKAVIYSHAVTSLKHGEIQRMRWLKGKLKLIYRYVPELILRGVRTKNIKMIDAAVELILPSYSMLFNWTSVVFLVSIILWQIGIIETFFVKLLLLVVFIQIIHFIIGLIINREPLKTWLSLAYVPIFLLWKFIITIKGVLSIRNSKWEKTERHNK